MYACSDNCLTNMLSGGMHTSARCDPHSTRLSYFILSNRTPKQKEEEQHKADTHTSIGLQHKKRWDNRRSHSLTPHDPLGSVRLARKLACHSAMLAGGRGAPRSWHTKWKPLARHLELRSFRLSHCPHPTAPMDTGLGDSVNRLAIKTYEHRSSVHKSSHNTTEQTLTMQLFPYE